MQKQAGFWSSDLYLRLYRWRRAVTMGLYSLVAAAAYLLAYLIRFEFDVPLEYQRTFAISLPLLLVARLAFNLAFRLTTSRWRFVGSRDIVRLFAASTIGTLVFYGAVSLFGFDPLVPRSVILLEWVLNTYGTAGLWFSYRTGFEEVRRWRARSDRRAKRVVMVGAGEAANLLAREMYRFPTGYRAIGFVDDDPSKWGTTLQGLPVFGGIDQLPRIVAREAIDEVIVAMPSATPDQLRGVVAHCESTPVPFKMLPGISEVIEGNVRLEQLRAVQIEDLLGREPIQLELPQLAADLRGRSVLVTGAAGSIGSELCRQIALHGPRVLVMMDQAETELFFLDRDLEQKHPALMLEAVVGDITDAVSVERVFQRFSPELVFHAAAYKHVPMMERNAPEAVRNNVVGTYRIAEAAGRHRADRFVLVSTDKAVRPSSVMGATKRLAEIVVLELQATYPETAFAAVRFGNVLGSNGSVIPIFRKQLEAGQPLTVTHEDATRYFMTIPEAVQLILQASLLENIGGHIAMLEMGEPVRIMELAENLLRLSGRPATRSNLVITGLRPGEKLHEELTAPDEESVATRIPQVRIIASRHSAEPVLRRVLEWEKALENGDDARILIPLRTMFPSLLLDLPEPVPAVRGA